MNSKKGVQNDRNSSVNKQKLQQQRGIQEKHREILNSMLQSNIMKPTNVEAQRILRVCDEWYQNVEILQYINKDYISQFYVVDDSQKVLQNTLIKNISEGTLKLLKKQAKIEHSYNNLQVEEELSEKEEKQNKSRNEDEDDDEEDQQDDEEKLRLEQEQKERRNKRQKEFERYNKLLAENTLNLIRNIRQNNQDYIIIKNSSRIDNEEIIDILTCVKSIQIIIQKKLSTAAEEEEQKSNQLQELEEKIGSLQQAKQNVQNELDKLKNERAKHNSEKKEEINNLKQQTLNVSHRKHENIEKLQKEKNEKIEQMIRESDKKEKQLIEEYNKLNTSFTTLKKTNKDAELNLKKKKQNVETQCSELFNSYDVLMENWKNEKTAILQEYNKIKSELKSLEEHFRNVDHEKQREKEVEAEIQAKKNEIAMHKKRMAAAALRIQIAFRNYKSKSSKKKKGKKGKKK